MTQELINKYPKQFSNVDFSVVKNEFKSHSFDNFSFEEFWNSKKRNLYSNGIVSIK